MSIISGVAVTWGASPRIITIPISYGTEVILDDLNDTLQSLEYSEEGICFPKLRDASGKEILSSTELVGLTMKLLNAKVKFEDRASPTNCSISGGNLVAVDVNNNPINPIEYSTNVTVSYAKSSSATMLQSTDITAIKAKTDNLPQYTASETTLQSLQAAIGTPTSTIAKDIDYLGLAISVLPGDPASQNLVEGYVDAQLNAIKGSGWNSETLKTIKQLIESTQRGQVIVR